MEVAGRVIEGELQGARRRRARSTTRRSRPGHRAAITEEERPGVFTMRVGNLPAGRGRPWSADADRPAALRRRRGDVPLSAGRRAALHPRHAAARRRRSATASRRTPTPCPTPRASRRRCCCPASPTRCGCRSASSVASAGLPLARLSLQPARRGRRRDRRRAAFACSRANGSTAISSCASAWASSRGATVAGLSPTRRRRRARSLLTLVPPAGARPGHEAARRGLRAGPLRQHGRLEDGRGTPRPGPHGRHADRRATASRSWRSMMQSICSYEYRT